LQKLSGLLFLAHPVYDFITSSQVARVNRTMAQES